MKINQLILIIAVSAFSFIFSSCEKQDKYIDWKVMNDEWFEAYKDAENSYPFVWTLDQLKNPMLTNSEFTTSKSGVKYRALRLGNPADRMPNPTSKVKVNFEGKLIDGTSFESSTDAQFYVGGVVSGFGEILLKMHIGDIYEFYLPYDLAYGIKGSGSIPPYSVLTFRVELTDAIY